MLTPHWFDITPIDKGLLIVGTIIATIIYVKADKKVKKIKEEIASTTKEQSVPQHLNLAGLSGLY
jgi:Na+/melibiose symporter-like transporter